MGRTRPRSYCRQYRETDFDFVRRLLAEEGLSWRAEGGEPGEVIVVFADSTRRQACPQDPSSAQGGAVRFHAAGAVEESDTVQALACRRTLTASSHTVLSYDCKKKGAVGTCQTI